MILKMIINIFRIFDPSSSSTYSINWSRSIIILVIFPFQFWLIPSRYLILWKLPLNSIFKEFNILINYSYSNLIIFLTLFSLIIINNLIGLFPYIFTSSRHIRFCLSFSISIWFAIIIYGWINFTNDIFIHLIPLGTPSLLIPFIVLIETISLIIRPITLSIRLTANIIAGHLLLSLLGSSGPIINNYLRFIIILIIIGQLLLIILEIAVAFIQAYVYSILSSLYSREI